MTKTRIAIDFSIFSPDAFGNATGDLDVVHSPAQGDEVELLGSIPKLAIPGFSGRLRVTSIVNYEHLGPGMVGYMLEDVELPSRDDALRLAKFLREELDLFVDEYGD